MDRIIDFEIGDTVQIETGFSNWDRSDNEFNCVVAGFDEKGRVVLDAQNAVCFDGRNSIQPYFVVDRNTVIEKGPSYNKIAGCYVLWDIVGMDMDGRFILKTTTKRD